ncbi:hypothetical protein ACTXT7_006601 [Hymenolepis weldensis]
MYFYVLLKNTLYVADASDKTLENLGGVHSVIRMTTSVHNEMLLPIGESCVRATPNIQILILRNLASLDSNKGN